MTEWLPDFVLTHSEREAIGHHNALRQCAKAAQALYETQDLTRRGEPGELLLHIALRQVFNTIPAISKMYFKDSRDLTVKGFDAVHVVAHEETLELWLGEAKFHSNAADAIRKAVADLADHTDRDYLAAEFVAITNKIDDNWPLADRLKLLLDKNTPLDSVFKSMCIPVFATYDSDAVAQHNSESSDFENAFAEEVRSHHKVFCNSRLPPVTIHLMLLPVHSKATLMTSFDKRLRVCQSLA